jgi:hypothetical protein
MTVVLFLARNSHTGKLEWADALTMGGTNSLISLSSLFLPHVLLETLQHVDVMLFIYSLSLWNRFIMHISINVSEHNVLNRVTVSCFPFKCATF